MLFKEPLPCPTTTRNSPWSKEACAALVRKLRAAQTSDEGSPCECAQQGEGVWLYSEDHCDPALLIDILAAVQRDYLQPPIGFGWSATCSKPTLDEFGGGAVPSKRAKPNGSPPLGGSNDTSRLAPGRSAR